MTSRESPATNLSPVNLLNRRGLLPITAGRNLSTHPATSASTLQEGTS